MKKKKKGKMKKERTMKNEEKKKGTNEKNEKFKKCEISVDFSRRFPGFAVVVVTFFEEIP